MISYQDNIVIDEDPKNILGKGSFGTVYKVIDKTDNSVYALKKSTPKTSLDSQNLTNEIYIMKKISMKDKCNSSIVCYYDSWKKNGTYYILTEYIDGVSVDKKFREYINKGIKEKVCFARDIAFALHNVHSSGIAHLDVKPENMLMEKNGNIKIIDFGYACDNTTILCKKNVGTAYYMDPEMAKQTIHKLPIDMYKLADVFSFGTMLYYLFNGGFPIYEMKGDTKNTYVSRKIALPLMRSETENKILDNLIDNMLDKAPYERPSMGHVYNELKKLCERLQK